MRSENDDGILPFTISDGQLLNNTCMNVETVPPPYHGRSICREITDRFKVVLGW